MNAQREVIYKRRDNALDGERLELDLMNSFYDICAAITDTTKGNYDDFKLSVFQHFGMDAPLTEDEFNGQKGEALTSVLYDKVYDQYKLKNKNLLENMVNPVLKQRYESNQAVAAEMSVQIPFTDGTKQLNILINLAKAYESGGSHVIKQMEQAIALALIDQNWKEHLRNMDDLKQQVQNASFEQKDPLLIYKFEALGLFKGFFNEVNVDVVSFLSKAGVAVENPEVRTAKQQPSASKKPQYQEAKAESRSLLSGDNEAQRKAGAAVSRAEVEVTKPIKSEKVYGRNDTVTVKYPDGTVKKDVKFKKVEQDVAQRRCVVVE